ncbi:MAG TPA: 3-oxoacid CoA-transferase subunit B [Ramlibacter sp.]|nr:3-oxoacid CoA-transferase subunit B [Ramlibacter sp.]
MNSQYTPLTRPQMAEIAAMDIPDGSYVNLGIGLPTLIADYVPQGRDILFHSEQGLLGLGPRAAPGEEDMDIVNAGKVPVTLIKGASIFDHAESFLIVRGGHLNLACLGAYQVASNGDLANWTTGDSEGIPGVGGAMDLAAGAKNVWVLMEHNQKDGGSRILEACTYPITAAQCVDRIYTNLAVFLVTPKGLVVQRMISGLDRRQLQDLTGVPLTWAESCGVYASGAYAYPLGSDERAVSA